MKDVSSSLNDAQIRAPLLGALAVKHPQALVLSEMQLRGWSAIVDVAAIDSDLHAYEIKSARDNLDRLAHQASYYDRTCDFVSLVTTTKAHLSAIPEHWGLLLATGAGSHVTFEWMRDPTRNGKASARDLLHVLRSTELARLLRANGQIRISALSKSGLVEMVLSLLGEQSSREVVKEVLRRRRTWTARQLGLPDDVARAQYARALPPPRLAIVQTSLFLSQPA